MATSNELKFVAEAKVAAVVSDYKIAINAGANKSVEVDDIVALRREVEVHDPDTNESLGKVYFTRLRLRIDQVKEKMAIAVVTDREAGDDSWVPGKVRRFKMVTTDPFEEDSRTVLVVIGEAATVARPQSSPSSEPPF